MLEASAIKHLVVHCSDTPDSDDMGAKDIHAMHLGFGWHGIGYHRVIKRDGTVERGRPDYWQGAHVYGHNEISLGVCLIGRHEFTDAQLDSLEVVLKQWQRNHPVATICGHRDFSYTDKTCPNFDVARWCISRKISQSSDENRPS